MGEVYRARDTRLDRHVALKVLPGAIAADSEGLARFEREAKLLASLNHAGIATIHGVEEGAGLRALVLELVEGGTLADRLAPGQAYQPLTVREVLAIMQQIADALDAAHERGIVHRDLKPSNVGLTPAGITKLLDFGIAKTLDPPAAAADRHGATTPALTQAGLVIGTAAYMSPEQARGHSVDKRTDIWAFGCMLFEMLSRSRAFSGPTTSDTIAAILQREPDWRALPPHTPPNLRRLLERCLQKDVRHRLRDIGDAHDYLADSAATSEAAAPATRWRSIEFQRLTDEVGINRSPAISPDGKMVAFVAAVTGRQHVWIRLLAGGAPLQLTRDDADHLDPRWSPDSSTLIYYMPPDTPGDEGSLWEVSALGGTPRPIVAALGGGDISRDGQRIAIVRAHQGQVVLMTVARDGSDARQVAMVPRGHYWQSPRWSPDNEWIAFHGRGLTVWEEILWIVRSRGGERRRIARTTSMRGASWLPDGTSLVYSSAAGGTMPYPPTFNLRVVNMDGSDDMQITSGDMSYVEPDVHQSGRVIVCRMRSESDIWRCPVAGPPAENTRSMTRVTSQTGQVQTPSVSPNGTELVYLSDNGGHANLWIIRTDGTRARQITFERDPAVTIGVPKWSPAGDAIVYVVNRELPQLWIVRPDGRGARKIVDRGFWATWSPDGQWVYYSPNVNGVEPTIEKVSLNGGPPVVVRNDGNSNMPTVGRDALYFAAAVAPEFGSWDWEIRQATPEDGDSKVLGRVSGNRVPFSPLYMHPALSADGQWLALGLADGVASNLWMLSTVDGSWRQVTDFGEQPSLIVRQVSWSPDAQHLYAAISRINGDVVMLGCLS